MLEKFAKYQLEEQCVVVCRIKFTGRLLAGIPKGGNPLDYYITSKHMSDADAESFRQRIAAGEVTEEEKAEMKDTNSLRFEPDRNGKLCIWCGNLKAMLREMFTSLAFTQIRAKTGDDDAKSAGGKQNLQHMIHVCRAPNDNGGHLRLLVNGEPVTESSASMVRVKHVKDASGTRSALGEHDYMAEGTELEFCFKFYAHGPHQLEHVERAMAMAQDDGLGACRSQSYGRFEIVRWDVVNDPPPPARVVAARDAAKAKKEEVKAKAEAKAVKKAKSVADEPVAAK
jgi:hypothetical protein